VEYKSGDHEIQYESMDQREKTVFMNLAKSADGERGRKKEKRKLS